MGIGRGFTLREALSSLEISVRGVMIGVCYHFG